MRDQRNSGNGVSPLRQSRDGSATLPCNQKPKRILPERHDMLKVAEASRLRSNQSRDGSSTFFTPDQLAWLNLIRDHIATSLSIEPEDLDLSPFNQQNGLGKAHQLFGDQLPKLLEELNGVLVA